MLDQPLPILNTNAAAQLIHLQFPFLSEYIRSSRCTKRKPVVLFDRLDPCSVALACRHSTRLERHVITGTVGLSGRVIAKNKFHSVPSHLLYAADYVMLLERSASSCPELEDVAKPKCRTHGLNFQALFASLANTTLYELIHLNKPFHFK